MAEYFYTSLKTLMYTGLEWCRFFVQLFSLPVYLGKGIEITPITEESNLKSLVFASCDNVFREYLLNDALFEQVLKIASTKLVYYKANLIGFYTLKSKLIEDKEIEIEIENENDGFGYVYGCTDLQYIYLSEKYRHIGIGKMLIKYIIKQVKQISEINGQRFITLNSVLKKHEWYYKNGFRYFDNEEINNPDPDTYTIKMYLDFINSEELDKYYEMRS